MTRSKIDFGIDLGTTNSALARMEKGKAVIKKTDTLKDTMPSCVGFNKKKSSQVGDSAWNTLKSDKLRAMRTWSTEGYNTFIEFKRTMGKDKTYSSSFMNRDFDSEELSAEVLKTLRSFVSDEDVHAAVITVPAKFEIRQKDATLRAAKLAGFTHCELLQEPIAASMAYGLDSDKKNGFWVVFDFGGGTFDAALLNVEDGIMQVIDTDGDNYLGGKNLDLAIVDEIIIPYLQSEYTIDSILEDDDKLQILKEAMKYYAEDAKIQMSFNDSVNILSDLGDIPGEDDEGEEFELDITVTKETLGEVLGPVFQKAVDITRQLLKRNNLSGDKLDSLILVGGPTYSPVLRDMLSEQITRPDTSIDPMTAVAVGAALYASTIDVSEEVKEQTMDKTKIQLEIGYEPSTVELEEWVTIKVLKDKTEGVIPDQLFAELVRADGAWSSGKLQLGDTGELIEAKLTEGKPNLFEVSLTDGQGNRMECEPHEITIIQGSKMGSATLPCNIGIEIKRIKDGKLVFEAVPGLSINQHLPAKGVRDGLKTQEQIRDGVKGDIIKIPLYEGGHGSHGSRAIYNVHVHDVIITGEDLPGLLPAGSEVNLSITTDKSGRIQLLEAFFPHLDYTVDIKIPESRSSELTASYLQNEIDKAKGGAKELSYNGHVDDSQIKEIEEQLQSLEEQLAKGKNAVDIKDGILSDLRKTLKRIDELDGAVEWPLLEQELREEFEKLEKADADLGNDRSHNQVNQIRQQLDEVIRSRDVKVGKTLLNEISMLFFRLTEVYHFMGWVKSWNEQFESTPWKDKGRARQLLNQALNIIADHPTADRLHPLIGALIDLIPGGQTPDNGGGVLVG